MSPKYSPLPFLPILRRAVLALIFVCALFTLFTATVEAASISGRVTNMSGEPIEQASVVLYWHTGTVPGSWVPGETVVTNANGEYTLASLGPGTYRLGFGHASSLYIYEYYNNQASLEAATNIVLANNNSTLSGYDVVLSSHGRVVGKVLDSENNPIEDIRVLRLDENGGYTEVIEDSTDASGDFELHLTNNDPFLLWFRHELYDYIGEYYDNAYIVEEADALTVLPDQVITVTAHLSRSKTISGTVTDSFGNPIGAEVVLYQKGDFDQWNMREHVYTSGYDGRYQFPKLPRGQFRLGFFGSEFLDEYYNEKETLDTADIIDLASAPDVVNIDVMVTRRGIITGTVTDLSNMPLWGILVSLYYEQDQEWILQAQSYTDSHGNYQFTEALPDRNYIVEFNSDESLDRDYVTGYYNNVTTIAAATIFTVSAETIIPNINAQLGRYAIVTGTVTGSGVPLEDVFVQPYWDPDATDTWIPLDSSHNTAETDESGHYTLRLPSGEFRIGFSHANYEAEFYDDQTSVSAATTISTPYNSETPNINAQLIPGAVISGTIIGPDGALLEGISVTAYRYVGGDDWENMAVVQSNALGNYAVSLASGTYRLKFSDTSGQFKTEYYADAEILDAATDIDLTFGNDLTVNAQLVVLPGIRGRVTDTAGNPIRCDVHLHRLTIIDGKSSWEVVYSTFVEDLGDGTYSFQDIEPGEYIVQFHVHIDNKQSEYYPNQRKPTTATVLNVTETTLFRGIDAVIDDYGTFVGTVVNEDNQPLAGINVIFYDEKTLANEQEPYRWDTTNVNGEFTLGFMQEVPYWIEIRDTSRQYAGEFYNNQPNIQSANPITVSPASTSTLSIELGASASITGNIRDWTGQPITVNAQVHLLRYWPQRVEKWQPFDSMYTDSEGNYRFDGLTPNAAYRIRVDGYEVPSLYYPHATTIETAQDIVVPTPMLFPNFNMIFLQPGEVYADFTGAPRNGTGSLTTNFTDQSLGNVTSRSWNFGDGMTSTQTNPSHTYSAPGVYTVTLTVSGVANSDVEQKASYITLADTPITAVGIQQGNPGGNPQAQPKVGQTIYFSATATGSNVQYLWDFGDDTLATAATATGQYVQHSYNTPGNYTVTLTARNGADEKEVTIPITIQDNEEPNEEVPVSALALHGPNSAYVNGSITLSATVGGGNNVVFTWDFGDGEGGTGEIVQHIYSEEGTYTITLTASNGVGEEVATMQITVQETNNEELVSALTLHGPSNASVNTSITFSATVGAGDNVIYTWDFGDGESGSGQVVQHTYSEAGAYIITLTASNGVNEEVVTREITIQEVEDEKEYRLSLPSLHVSP